MSNTIGGISVSHAPGITGWPDAPKEEEKRAVFAAFDHLKEFVANNTPDVMVVFLDDHFDNHFRDLMPALSVGVAETHTGPGAAYHELLKLHENKEYDGAPELAESLLIGLVDSGFDVTRMGQSEFGNNFAVPIELIRPEADIAVIPVYINVFTPPIISMQRAYDFGQAVRRVTEGWDQSVLFMGTGGLSHWPPVWYAHKENDDFLERMGRYQQKGASALKDDPTLRTDVGPWEMELAEKLGDDVVNPEWDEEFLELIVAGDIASLTAMSYDYIEENGGHGAHEVLNWMAVSGAMGGGPCEKLVYAPTPEWICGTGAVLYDPQDGNRS